MARRMEAVTSGLSERARKSTQEATGVAKSGQRPGVWSSPIARKLFRDAPCGSSSPAGGLDDSTRDMPTPSQNQRTCVESTQSETEVDNFSRLTSEDRPWNQFGRNAPQERKPRPQSIFPGVIPRDGTNL